LAPVDGYSDDTIVIRVLTGDVPTRIRFAPRLDYATVPTRMTRTDDGVQVLGTSEPIELHAPGLDFELVEDGDSQTAEATVVPRSSPAALSCSSSPAVRAPVTPATSPPVGSAMCANGR